MMGFMRTARVYDDIEDGDPPRFLVDRLWPRGMRKDDERVGTWLPAVAPSNELRRWYDHRDEAFAEFADRYVQELETGEAAEALDRLRRAARQPIMLTTASKHLEISHVVVLVRHLEPA